MNIRRYSMALKKLGFRKLYDSRKGGARVVEFENTFGNRKVQVQLWGDGQHRATHFLNGLMNTSPTPFDGLTEMERAIQRELTRTDHPKPSRTAKRLLSASPSAAGDADNSKEKT